MEEEQQAWLGTEKYSNRMHENSSNKSINHCILDPFSEFKRIMLYGIVLELSYISCTWANIKIVVIIRDNDDQHNWNSTHSISITRTYIFMCESTNGDSCTNK